MHYCLKGLTVKPASLRNKKKTKSEIPMTLLDYFNLQTYFTKIHVASSRLLIGLKTRKTDAKAKSVCLRGIKNVLRNLSIIFEMLNALFSGLRCQIDTSKLAGTHSISRARRISPHLI